MQKCQREIFFFPNKTTSATPAKEVAKTIYAHIGTIASAEQNKPTCLLAKTCPNPYGIHGGSKVSLLQD
jgi:hypothetical protein